MNYANIYKEKTHKEIFLILESIDKLSYEAKTALYKYLQENKRGIEVSSEKLDELKKSYQLEEEDINSLNYLSNLGFKIIGTMNDFKIIRTRSAKLVDIVGAVIGIVLLLVLKLAIGQWQKIVYNGFEILDLIFGIIFTIVGIFGLILFTKTLYRFVDYFSFKINKKGSKITICRIEDLKRKTYQIDNSSIMIATEEGVTTVSFVANDHQQVNLLSSSGGRVLQNTLTRLGNVLKE
ncbi:MAG: hypothetical protein OEW67_09650 [Cyclobacteriaceae bacterium]|nr:hypothetical protein [Cyclobacteriaceae bacterium]